MLIFWDKTNSDRAKIHTQSWQSKEEESVAIERYDYLEIEEIQIPVIEDNGKIAQLYINPMSNELWYEYQELPIDEKIVELESRVIELEEGNDELTVLVTEILYS